MAPRKGLSAAEARVSVSATGGIADFGGEGGGEGEGDGEKRKRKQELEEERDRLWHIKLAEGMKESLRLQQEYEKAHPTPIKPTKRSKPSQTDPNEDPRNVQYGTSFNWKEFGF